MDSKIKDLFEYRKLPLLLSFDKIGIKDKLLLKLVQLQKEIYYLDKYLESSWDVDLDVLETYWVPIYEALADFGIMQKEMPKYVNLIKRYQEHELAIRRGIIQSQLSLDYYYYYKSCDVKLLRKLIVEFIPELLNEMDLSDWIYFDLITELNDDIEDIQEDKDVNNGNGFILNAYLNGLDQTYDNFVVYINEIMFKSEQRAYNFSSEGWNQKICNWTLEYGKQTLELLHDQKIILDNNQKLINENQIVMQLATKG